MFWFLTCVLSSFDLTLFLIPNRKRVIMIVKFSKEERNIELDKTIIDEKI